MPTTLQDLPETSLRAIIICLINPTHENLRSLADLGLTCRFFKEIMQDCIERWIKEIAEKWLFIVDVPFNLRSLYCLLEPKFFFVGGSHSSRTCHQFSQVTGTFRRRCSLGFKREIDSSLIFHRGLLFCFGGSGGPQKVEVYDMFSNIWTEAIAAPGNLVAPNVVMHQGDLFIVGGLNGADNSRSSSVFRLVIPSLGGPAVAPSFWSWDLSGSLTQGRSHCGVVSYGGFIWLAGGILSGQTFSTNTVELYDPNRQLSLPAPNMLRHRRNPKLIVIDGVLYAVGGDVEDVSYAVGSIERFEISKQCWVFVTFFLEPRRRGQCAIEAFGSKIFIFGGGHGQNIWKNWDFYDVYGNYWASQVQQNLQLSDPNFSPVHVPSEADKALLRRVSLHFSAARAEGMIGTTAAHNPYAWSC